MNIIALTLIAVNAAGFAIAAPTDGNTTEGSWYIFGYGSLLSSSSRIRSACSLQGVTEDYIEWTYLHFEVESAYQGKDARCIQAELNKTYIPSRILGARRGWYEPGTVDDRIANNTKQKLFLQPTYLGLFEDEGANVTGLLYPVSDQELAESDARESTANYNYVTLSTSDIEFYGDHAASVPTNAQIRVYFNKQDDVTLPSALHPIVQSYVDVFLGGAIEIEEGDPEGAKGYALETCMGTYGWVGPWLNDRPYPKYRSSFNSLRSEKIDQLLLDCAGNTTFNPRDNNTVITPLTFTQFDNIYLS